MQRLEFWPGVRFDLFAGAIEILEPTGKGQLAVIRSIRTFALFTMFTMFTMFSFNVLVISWSPKLLMPGMTS